MFPKLSRNVYLYLFILFFSLLVHALFFIKFGPCPSTDYQTVYEPEAVQIVEWVHGQGAFPDVSFYQISHLGYVSLITLIFLLFGQANLSALIIFQVVFTFAIFAVFLHICLKKYRFSWVAVLFTCFSLLFLDNIQWTFWSVPDSIYRVFFIIAYYVLLELYFKKCFRAFLITVIFSSVFLSFIRIDTFILFLPLYFLAARIVAGYLKESMFRKAVGIIIFIFCSILILPYIKNVFKVYTYWFYNGWVLPGTDYNVLGVTKIESFDYAQAHNLFYLAARQFKLMGLRFYQFFNIFPPFWSKGHQFYYAAHMLLFYFFSIFALVRSIKEKDKYIRVFLYVYFCSMLIHVLTFVDAAKRQTFSVLPFLIIFAGYGFDYCIIFLKEKLAIRSK